MTENNQRFVAYKATVTDVLNAPVQGGTVLWNNHAIERIHLIGVIISIQEKDKYLTIFIDDGTGSLPLRVFNHGEKTEFAVENVFEVIGRLRIWGQEKYVVSEIMRRIHDRNWIYVWKKEIETFQKYVPPVLHPKVPLLPVLEKCILLIKKLDTGDGVGVEEILRSGICEDDIYRFIKEGAIFETGHGRVKVLD